MEAPPGVSIPRDHCFVLDKAIYGCKQSARAWSDELDSHLEKIGFSRTTADPCLWTRSRNGKEWYVATYVDEVFYPGILWLLGRHTSAPSNV